ncbi:MAG: hypothetical protein NXI24_01165 [bacterium]|nr:hypothetical protein [bacterium]
MKKSIHPSRGALLCAMILFATPGCRPDSSAGLPRSVDPLPGETRLSNLRMLTDAGQNAEAYFSFDESRLVFQAKTGDMGCDQIFSMNLSGGDVRRISSGEGATTCAYYLPGDERIVYASTHAAGPDCPPEPDRSQGYVWQLYDSYDIYSADASGGEVRRLTDAPGYDAEATVSPQGDKIVFTSMRDGDPELYLMDLDGGNQTRLTFAKGYDGGAFFSPDGKRLIFRASRPETPEQLRVYTELVEKQYVRPTELELYVMNVDGTGLRKITNYGRASFGPFFHPDGERVIFSSNMQSENPRNFDLYIVGVDGQGLERITHNETFDGFPMFTRDGRRLVFASNRHNKQRGDTNIFIADWNE